MTISTVAQTDTFDAWRILFNTTVARWNDLGESSAIVITGGTIDNVVIGGTTPSTAEFTNCIVNSTLDVRGGSFLIDDNSISGDKITGGTADVDNLVINNTPTVGTHATTKTYVDNEIETVGADAVALAIALG